MKLILVPPEESMSEENLNQKAAISLWVACACSVVLLVVTGLYLFGQY